MVFIKTNALSPIERELVTENDYDTLIDFLQEYYPNGFDRPTDVYLMTRKIEVDNYDMKLDDDSVVILVERPAVAAALGLTGFWAWVVNTSVMMAVNFAVSKLFAPSAPKDQGSPSSVYGLNSSQNSAKLGDPIPVGYGTFNMYPSYIEQPYYKYVNNNEYLYLLLCVGAGRYDINSLFVDTIDVTNSDVVDYKMIYKENFSDIEDYIGDSEYVMHSKTYSTPSQYENIPYESPKWDISKDADEMEFDIVFPEGLFNFDKEGNVISWSGYVYFKFYSNGTLVDTARYSWRASSRSAFRRTVRYSIDKSKNITHFTVYRNNYASGSGSSRVYDKSLLYRVKEIHKQYPVTNYGDISLLWVKMKASNAISSAGQNKVNGFFTRTDKTNKIKDVITDIYTNKDYGAGLRETDLHLIDTQDEFNGVFEVKETVWDAINRMTKAQKYTVYPMGQDILLKHDAPATTSVALYNETNILRGSFSIQYTFDDEIEQYDCVEVIYRTSDKWEVSTRKYPESGILPKSVDLFGVTDDAKAEEMAKYLWKQEKYRNKVISFDTDIQYMTLEFLDKIKVSHSSLMWGEAGHVEEVNGRNIRVSEKITTSSNITFRNIDGSVSDTLTFTKVSDYEIEAPNAPLWVKEGTFYTVGVAKEFLVVEVSPKDENTATVKAVEYMEDVYT